MRQCRISCQIEPLPKALPPELSPVLAWTIWEGVTNVIRHSRAQHCLIRLNWENETVVAEVINDGGREGRAESASARPGLGLAGLRERVTALGGRLEAGLLPWPDKDRFRLWVELPLQSRVQTARAQLVGTAMIRMLSVSSRFLSSACRACPCGTDNGDYRCGDVQYAQTPRAPSLVGEMLSVDLYTVVFLTATMLSVQH